MGICLQLRDPLVEQIVSDMLRSGIFAMYSELYGSPHYVQFAKSAVPGDSLDCAAAAVARGKIAAGISAARIASQHRFHQACSLEDFCEVDPREGSQAIERVGSRDALRGF